MNKLAAALYRARWSIITAGLVHFASLAAGMAMAHLGIPFALTYRDRLVGRALASDPVSRAYQRGAGVTASLLEAARTEVGCVAVGVTGLTVIAPIALAGYRGWIGGIVSVDGSHASRLRQWRQAAYYLSVVILQLIPYCLAAGAGLNLGLLYFRRRKEYAGPTWFGYPRKAIRDFIRILVLTVPLVLAANFWEFLSPLNV